MRAGLSTIQQTLTPEAASVLNHSIAEATRRNHGQTTPLHVAATLLASPSGYLRQACIKSHPNSSHPLQCRALELCFSVALERLPTAQNLSPGHDPPISNALMAALKRAQAHQRRGCPEQQQQPLLAVKVELEQLIISILDDPSVSRVMREASFSSPAVKATIEQSLNSPSNSSAAAAVVSNSTSFGFGFRTPGSVPIPIPTPTTNRNLYANPRLQQGGIANSGHHRNDELKRLVDILLKNKKRNPVLVGESDPEMVVKELLKKIESKEIEDKLLQNLQVIHIENYFLDKAQISPKIAELQNLIEARTANSDYGGVILNLGDLKWLVEQPVNLPATPGGIQQQLVSEAGRSAVAEMGKLLAKSGDRKIWLIGTATCETYLRCQVYHPSMENDWDLQAVPIAPRAPRFPRIGTNGILSNTIESFSPLRSSLTVSPNFGTLDIARKATSCCPQCMQNYEKELAKIESNESEATQPLLPSWLKNAKSQDSDSKMLDQTTKKDEESLFRKKSADLQKKWHDTCRQLHPGYHNHKPPCASESGMETPNLLPRKPFVPKLGLNKTLIGTHLLSPNLVKPISPPQSPVRTELALGRPKSPVRTEFVASEPRTRLTASHVNKLLSALDADSFKRLLKGLTEKVWWQREAASAVATTVTQCKLGLGKRQGGRTGGDTWLLFSGPDRAGKRRMASALSELVSGANCPNLTVVTLGSRLGHGDSDLSFRGKTALDRVVEAVRKNPFSIVMLENIDKADMLVRGSIKQAIERGRISDSHGREISLGNVIFILTAESPKHLSLTLDENKLSDLDNVWQLKLSLCRKTAKRRKLDENRSKKDPGLSFDLNEAADAEELDKGDGSHNSSDLTVENEDENGNVLINRLQPAPSVPLELLDSVDDNIVFKNVDFGSIQSEVSGFIAKRFSAILAEEELALEIQEEALEKIAGGLWTSKTSLEEFTEQAIVPSIRKLKMCLPANREESMVVRIEPDGDSPSRSHRDRLPENVRVVVDGL